MAKLVLKVQTCVVPDLLIGTSAGGCPFQRNLLIGREKLQIKLDCVQTEPKILNTLTRNVNNNAV